MVIYSICALLTITWTYEFFVKKNYFGALTYIWAGIVFPLFMYQLGWSKLIDTSNSEMFNYIFICLTICIIFYLLSTKGIRPRPISSNQRISITKTGKVISPILNIGFLLLYLIENYLGSGSFVPGLQKIDIHTYAAPIISYLTNTPFLVLAFDYYAFKATKKKKYWVWILLVVAIPFITRSSRMQMMIGALQFISLLLFIEAPGAITSLRARKNYKRIKRILIGVGIVAVIGLTQFTNYRMNHYGVYNFSYADLIGFNGPKQLAFLAPYYGYFPLSFNNLKINLTRLVSHNYIGLYSFSCLFFGVFQLDNLLGIDTLGNIKNRIVTHSAATVPTGFWDFYYDFDYLCFIPMLVAFFICYWLLKKSKRENNRLTFRTLYFWFIPLWFFMSFQNVIFSSTIIIAGVLIEIIIRRSFLIYCEE